MSKNIKRPIDQQTLETLVEWRGRLRRMQDWAEEYGQTQLITTLGPPIGVIEGIIQDCLDPAKETA